MKVFLVLSLVVILGIGCAKMQVGGSKEPIKVDISMRLDIYQHVQKDIDEIENIVSGFKEKDKPKEVKGNQSRLQYLVANAYAQEGLNPDVEQAALRRKDRRPELLSWQERGVIGENKSGLVEIRDSNMATTQMQELVSAENNDRMLIYRSIAGKNSTSIDEVQKIYAKRLQEDAPGGAPIEILNQATATYKWKIK